MLGVLGAEHKTGWLNAIPLARKMKWGLRPQTLTDIKLKHKKMTPLKWQVGKSSALISFAQQITEKWNKKQTITDAADGSGCGNGSGCESG